MRSHQHEWQLNSVNLVALPVWQKRQTYYAYVRSQSDAYRYFLRRNQAHAYPSLHQFLILKGQRFYCRE